MDRYLAGEDIEVSTLIEDLEKAVAGGTFYPVIPVCAETRLGLDALLEVLTSAFPSPLERDLPTVTGLDGSPKTPLTCDPDGPLVAEVVKTTIDSYVGRVSLVRVFSGTLKPESTVHISGHGLETARPPRPRRRRTHRSSLLASGRPAARGAARDRRRHRRDHEVRHRPRPATRCPQRISRCSSRRGTCRSPCCRWRSWRRPAPTRTRSRRTSAAWSPETRRCASNATPRRASSCCGAWVRPTPTWSSNGCVPVEPISTPSRSAWHSARRSPTPAKGHGRHVKQSGGHGQYARLRHRGRAPAPRQRVRVRGQGRWWCGAAQLHPLRGEGRPRPDGARSRGGPSGRWTCG